MWYFKFLFGLIVSDKNYKTASISRRILSYTMVFALIMEYALIKTWQLQKDYKCPLVHKSKMTFFAKCSILNFWQGSEYPFEHPPNILQMQVNFSFTLKSRNSHLISLLSLFVATINIIAFTISFCLFCIVIFVSKFEALFISLKLQNLSKISHLKEVEKSLQDLLSMIGFCY